MAPIRYLHGPQLGLGLGLGLGLDVLGQAMPEVPVRLLMEARHLRVDGGAYLLAPDLGRLVRVRV